MINGFQTQQHSANNKIGNGENNSSINIGTLIFLQFPIPYSYFPEVLFWLDLFFHYEFVTKWLTKLK